MSAALDGRRGRAPRPAGSLTGPATGRPCGVSIDSRTRRARRSVRGARGPRASTAMTSSPRRSSAGRPPRSSIARPAGARRRAPLLVVADTLAGLRAAWASPGGRAAGRSIVGVTGSVGKTGSKEALAPALGTPGRDLRQCSQPNNHWGVPLSLARLPREAALRRVRARHESSPARSGRSPRMVRPRRGLITTDRAGPSRILRFASRRSPTPRPRSSRAWSPAASPCSTATMRISSGWPAMPRRHGIARSWASASIRAPTCAPARAARLRGREQRGHGRASSAGASTIASARPGGMGAEQPGRAGGGRRRWAPMSGSQPARSLASAARPRAAASAGRSRCPAARCDADRRELQRQPGRDARRLRRAGPRRAGPNGRRIAVLGDMLELGDAVAGAACRARARHRRGRRRSRVHLRAADAASCRPPCRPRGAARSRRFRRP